MAKNRRTWAWVLLGMAGCSAQTVTGPSASGTGTDGGAGQDGGTVGDAGPLGNGDGGLDAGPSTGVRTLENCTTTVAADAPEFFKRYFKCVTITATATEVVIQTNDLPPHLSNYYGNGHPNYAPFDSSRGSQYRANPNALGSQNVKLTIPLNPTSRNLTITQVMVDGVVKSNAQEYPMGAAGVALDSVVLYNPLAAPGDDIENEKYTFDSYNAHPDPSKTYHYHTTSKGPLEVLQKLGLTTNTTPGSGGIELYGIMCDGTVVLGCKELDGTTPAANRDPQGGHVHDIADAEKRVYFAGRYHTHVCESGTGNRKFTPEIQYYSTCNLTK